MKAVWKFRIDPTDAQPVAMPAGAKVLSVGTQGGDGPDDVMLWALVDTSAPTTRRLLTTHGTGHPVATFEDTEPEYVGSYQLRGGRLVFHVFDHGEVLGELK